MMKKIAGGIGRVAFFYHWSASDNREEFLVPIINTLTSCSKVLLPTASRMVTRHGRKLGGSM